MWFAAAGGRVLDHGNQRGVHRGQVVQPPAGEELVGAAEDLAALRVGDDHVVAADLRRVHAGGFGEHRQHVGLVRVADAPDRVHVGLLVQRQAVVDGAVQVDGELREAQHRRGAGQHRGAVGHGQAPGEQQFAVQPGVQQRAAVDLHAGLQPAVRAGGRLGLELEGGRVGVGAQDVEAGGRGRRFGLHPGDDRPVADDEVLAGAQLPGRALIESGEAGVGQAAGRFGRRVEAGGRGRHEGSEVVDVVKCCCTGHGGVPLCRWARKGRWFQVSRSRREQRPAARCGCGEPLSPVKTLQERC